MAAKPRWSDSIRSAPAAQSVAEKLAFGLRHSGLHSARAEGPRTVTIATPTKPEDAWQTDAAVRSLIRAAVTIQRAHAYRVTAQVSAWVVEVAE